MKYLFTIAITFVFCSFGRAQHSYTNDTIIFFNGTRHVTHSLLVLRKSLRYRIAQDSTRRVVHVKEVEWLILESGDSIPLHQLDTDFHSFRDEYFHDPHSIFSDFRNEERFNGCRKLGLFYLKLTKQMKNGEVKSVMLLNQTKVRIKTDDGSIYKGKFEILSNSRIYLDNSTIKIARIRSIKLQRFNVLGWAFLGGGAVAGGATGYTYLLGDPEPTIIAASVLTTMGTTFFLLGRKYARKRDWEYKIY